MASPSPPPPVGAPSNVSVSVPHHAGFRKYKPELVVVIDTEMDGTDPLTANLLSLGLVAVRVNIDEKTNLTDAIVCEFYCTVARDPSKPPNFRNYEAFWSKHPKAWQAAIAHPLHPYDAMHGVSEFLKELSKSYHIKFVAKPACVDWMFFKSYYEAFGPVQKHPLGYRCDCLDTMNKMYKLLTGDDITLLRGEQMGEYNHHALCDARCQAFEYLELRRKINGVRKTRSTKKNEQ